MQKQTIAISIGDISGVGIQLALQNHKIIKKLCNPIYCINKKLLKQAALKLGLKIPKSFKTYKTKGDFEIQIGLANKESGLFSYNSFLDAINLVKDKKAIGVCTLPINKESWNLANIHYVGHTDMLRDIFKQEAIMMLGCEKMYVALFTEHIALKNIANNLTYTKLYDFLYNFYKSENPKKVAVLGLNPHAGDNGVLGDEEKIITRAIKDINNKLKEDIFDGPKVPDIIFSKNSRKKYKYFIAMYHDQGLIPLKALYFEESINISLNLPIKRTSVDHGTAFDIAYKNNNKLSSLSYINAIKKLIEN